MTRFKLSHSLPAIALLALASLPAAAAAEDDAIANLLANAEPAAAVAAGEGDAVDVADLEGINGEGLVIDNSFTAEDSVLSMSEMNATNSDNVIHGAVNAGDVSFDGDALRGFNGVGNFVINTGAQSNLQGSINITIVTAAP